MEEAINKLIDKVNNQLLLEATTFEDAVFHLNDQILRTPDEVAPMKTKLTPKHNKKPWCHTDLHGQRRIIKNRERKWLKYRTAELWMAYK